MICAVMPVRHGATARANCSAIVVPSEGRDSELVLRLLQTSGGVGVTDRRKNLHDRRSEKQAFRPTNRMVSSINRMVYRGADGTEYHAAAYHYPGDVERARFFVRTAVEANVRANLTLFK
jgi:hypothetical protein